MQGDALNNEMAVLFLEKEFFLLIASAHSNILKLCVKTHVIHTDKDVVTPLSLQSCINLLSTFNSAIMLALATCGIFKNCTL